VSNELKSLSPTEAWEICRQNSHALLIDVRSSMEHLFVGHPVGAVHVPWIDEPEWVVNPHFVTDIRKLILGGVVGDDDSSVPIILICRSGKRSKEAGQLLIDSGIHNVYNIDEGFEGELDNEHHRSTQGGWRYHNLPWQQC
jgi:rhodanese-related sulfurtransferase